MGSRGLTAKQERFVSEYLLDLNATAAARRAGYSMKNADQIGPQLLGKTRVQAAISVALKARQERTAVTQDWVLTKLKENLERAMQAIPVLDSEGKPTGEYRYHGGVANKALELLGRHLGMFPNRHEVTGEDGGPIHVTLSRAERTARIRNILIRYGLVPPVDPACDGSDPAAGNGHTNGAGPLLE